MSITSLNQSVKFSPFHAILQDGIDRLLELLPNEEFTFIVNGEQLKTTLSEAVLISPIISERLKTDPMNREFYIESDEIEIEMKQFSVFIDIIRNRNEWIFSTEDGIAILSICKLIGNDQLSLFVLGSVHCDISSKSLSLNVCKSEVMNISEKSVEDCASKFNSYSTEELRNIPKQLLHSLLSSPSLAIESEDSLLQQLIDLGSEYFEYWCYLEIAFLSTEGISEFAKAFPFEELRSTHWEKIVDRLIGVCDETLRLHRFCKIQKLNESNIDSKILSNIPTPLKQFESKKWTLLYRGSQDGFKSSNFHSKCDGHSNTVTVILTTKGFIFGGFTPIAWDSKTTLES
jgi:hypothetical protein